MSNYNQTVNDGVAHSKNLETIVFKFGRDPAICLGKEAIFVPAQKCPYHVTFDLEHTLDAR